MSRKPPAPVRNAPYKAVRVIAKKNVGVAAIENVERMLQSCPLKGGATGPGVLADDAEQRPAAKFTLCQTR